MNILFIADPLSKFKIAKETTYAMMKSAQARGHKVWACVASDIRSVGCIQAHAQRIVLKDHPEPTNWYSVVEEYEHPLSFYDAVVMRKDPPFDVNYVTDTWLLDAAVRQGAKVFNAPSAIRNHSEKVSILEFPELTTPTLIASDKASFVQFHAQHHDIILKPLDGMGGSSIFRHREDDPNLSVILETLTAHGTQQIMAQQYLPAIKDGDKRILMIDGEPVPYCLARIPAAGETRGNLAAGGRGEARPLTDKDRWIAEQIGPELRKRGLLFVGLDVIGEHLTEINVTSPTCIREIDDAFDTKIGDQLMDAIARKLAERC